MGKRKWREQKKQEKQQKQPRQEPEQLEHGVDPLLKVIAVHPLGNVAVTAVGKSLRVVDCRTSEKFQLGEGEQHSAAIRFASFNENGSLLLTGGDDKTIKIWHTNKWNLVASWQAPKRISAGTFTRDSRYVIFSDKFGDVLVAELPAAGAQPSPAAPLFGHTCAIISSLSVSFDNRFVVSTDKDAKVRVSILPSQPLKGAWQIQTYCLGHLAFVSSAAWVPYCACASGEGQQPRNILVSGGGDGTVKIWDVEDGSLLDTFVAAEPKMPPPQQPASAEAVAASSSAAGPGEDVAMAEASSAAQEVGPGDAAEVGGDDGDGGMEGGSGDEEDGEGGRGDEGEAGGSSSNRPQYTAVLSVAVSPCGRYVAALVDGEHGVTLLAHDPSSHKLALLQRVDLPGLKYPCSATWDKAGRLWVSGGPPLDTSQAVHVAVAAKDDVSGTFQACTQAVVPDAARALLEVRDEQEEKTLETAELTSYYSYHLRQRGRGLTQEKKEAIALVRNDYKDKAARAAYEAKMAARKQQQEQKQQQGQEGQEGQ